MPTAVGPTVVGVPGDRKTSPETVPGSGRMERVASLEAEAPLASVTRPVKVVVCAGVATVAWAVELDRQPGLVHAGVPDQANA